MLEVISPLYALSGFAVGVIVGLTGVGGGSLMTPLLVLLFGVHPATAVGTDLLYACLTKVVGTVVHGRHGAVDWRLVRLLASGSVPASALTILALRMLGPATPANASWINLVLGLALLLTAASMAARGRLRLLAPALGELPPRRQAALTIGTGVVIGALVSMSSVGAGAIGVTALYFLYPRLSARGIVASDIAHAVPLTLVAGIGHWFVGSVDLGMLGSLLTGSIPGIIVGGLLAPRVPEGGLRMALAAVLTLVGARLAFFA